MTNKSYLKGRAKEYRIMKKYRDRGLTVIRSAGSHGFADLVAIDFQKKWIYWIQCKPDSMSTTERNKLLLENERINGEFTNVFIIE